MRTLFGLFDSPHMSMRLHVREGVKNIIFILNPNLKALKLDTMKYTIFFPIIGNGMSS